MNDWMIIASVLLCTLLFLYTVIKGRKLHILLKKNVYLEERVEELNSELEEERNQRGMLQERLEELRYEADFHAEEFFPYLFDEPYVHYYDSLDVKPDSVLMVYRLININRTDTLYDGIRIVLKDTLAIKDTVAVKDTVPVREVVKVKSWAARRDSILSGDIRVRPKGRMINKKQIK